MSPGLDFHEPDATLDVPGLNTWGMHVDGDILYTRDHLISIEDPLHPELLGPSPLPGNSSMTSYSASVHDNHFIRGNDETGMIDFYEFFPPDSMELRARVAASYEAAYGYWTPNGDTLWICDSNNMSMYLVEGMPNDVEDDPGSSSAIPGEFRLHQAYPNPFNPTTTIQYDLPRASDVRIIVYDLLGREVVRLVDGHMRAGYHRVNWHASDLTSGMYFYSLQAGAWQDVKKAILLK
jgi:hypothetical protein